jgi:hypothetical protein
MLKLAAAITLATFAFAAPAAAQSISLATAADPVEDAPFLVTATGVGAKYYRAFATIKPAGASPCGASYETDADGTNVLFSDGAEGPFTIADTAVAPEPGPYLLCAWLQKHSGDPAPIAVTSTTVTARSAVASLTISGPALIAPGRTANFLFSGTSELSRTVYATVKPDGPRGCGASRSLDEGAQFLWETAQGNYAVQDAPSKYEIRARTVYRVCAWVQEGSGDTAPEAAATYTFRVGTATCARLTRAQRAVRRAQRAVRDHQRGAKTRLRKARRQLAAARRAC